MVTIGEYIHLNKEDYYKYGITRRTPGGASAVAAYSQPDLFNKQRSQILKGIQLGNSAKANAAQAQLERDLQQIFFNSDNYKAQGDKQNAMYEQFASLMNQYIDQRFGQMNFDDSNGPVGYKMREIDTSQSFVTLGRLKHIRDKLVALEKDTQFAIRTRGTINATNFEVNRKAIVEELDTLFGLLNDSPVWYFNQDDPNNLVGRLNTLISAVVYPSKKNMGEIAEAAVTALNGMMYEKADMTVDEIMNRMQNSGGRNTVGNLYETTGANRRFSKTMLTRLNQEANLQGAKVNSNNNGYVVSIETNPSQQKCDVVVNIKEQPLYTSIKNYSSIQAGIHLVDKSPLLNMVIGMDLTFVNHWLNKIAVNPDDTGYKDSGWETTQQAMKLALAAVALTGFGATLSGQADTFVMIERSTKRVYVRSMEQMIDLIASHADGLSVIGLPTALDNKKVGDKPDWLSAQVRIGHILAQLHACKISMSYTPNGAI